MPNRIIRDAILSSERVASLGWPEEVFYRRLHSVVDDYGRYEANPQLLRARCYPLQTDSVRAADITRWTAACQKAGLLLGYEVAGKSYLEVLNFGQQLRSASKFPPPPAVASNCLQAPSNEHLDVSVSVSGVEVVKPAPPAFVLPDWIPLETWDAYCKVRSGKKAKNEPHALGLIVKDLEGFRAAGHDPVVVLNNSIKSSWVGVFEPKTKLGHQPASTTSGDPDSRSAIEAEGVAKGIGPWNEINEQWHVYKARVRGGRPTNNLGLDALAAMAAQRSQAGAH